MKGRKGKERRGKSAGRNSRVQVRIKGEQLREEKRREETRRIMKHHVIII